MNLFIVAQKIDRDDENLGFFHRWVEEFAKHYTGITVIASFVGRHDLPKHIAVFSFGKENGAGLLKRIWRYWRLFRRHCRASDAIFFHMIPEFVLAAFPFLLCSASRYGRPSALWYVHKSVTRTLRVAERMIDYVFTASELSFRLPSKKVIITGHAIDTDIFTPDSGSHIRNSRNVRLLTVGRIAPVKDIETMILAGAVLKNVWDRQWTLSVIGGPMSRRDEEYFMRLKSLAGEKGLSDHIFFLGPRPYGAIPAIYRDHDIFISLSRTGSVDKSVLEAMSSGLSVICANEAFQSILPAENFLENRDPEALARRIMALADGRGPREDLRSIVVENHGLARTIKRIVDTLTPRS